jgi:DNA-binding CsgD family transcriptional regulator
VASDRLERTIQPLQGVVHHGLDLPGFFAASRAVLDRAVPIDACCWLAFDPATLLPTAHVAMESVPSEQVPRLARNEFQEEDFNKFRALARSPVHAGILREATGGDPERSVRYREILRPNGLAAELRTSFVADSSCWGAVAMYRAPGNGEYRREDAELMHAVSALMAEGMRRALLTTAVASEPGTDAPGLVLLDADDRVDAMNAAAEHWLAELPFFRDVAPGNLPSVAYALVDRARRLADGEATASHEVARTRVRTLSGRWLVLHASQLDGEEGRAALIIEPARAPEIAPLIAGAYGFTERERDVAQLVMRGLSTAEIANALHLSPYTVQDHLKAIFEKVGVRSRRELVAQVFFEHYAPRMSHGENLAPDGWFARASTQPPDGAVAARIAG